MKRSFATSPEEVVLDIGSGDSPFAPADVICEKFPWDDTERTQGFKHDRPLVAGDAEDLPFKDKAFDFIHCSHVLEHVYHPDRAIQELMRVGKRGYIEMPRSFLEKSVKSTAGHFWFVNLTDGRLIFKPKAKGILDTEINSIHETILMDKDPLFSAFFYARFYDLLNIGLFWKGNIPYSIEGDSRVAAVTSGENFEKATIEPEKGEKKAPPRFTVASVLKNVVRRRSAKKNFDLDALLACPTCKGSLDKKLAESIYVCRRCEVSYPMRGNIPILLRESAKPMVSLV